MVGLAKGALTQVWRWWEECAPPRPRPPLAARDANAFRSRSDGAGAFRFGGRAGFYLAVRSRLVLLWAQDIGRYLTERECLRDEAAVEAAKGSLILVSRAWHLLDTCGHINFGAPMPADDLANDSHRSALEEAADEYEAQTPKARPGRMRVSLCGTFDTSVREGLSAGACVLLE